MSAIGLSIAGFSLGAQYTLIKDKEDEVKEGKNYYISTLHHPTQLTLASVVAKVLTTTFLQRPAPLPLAIAYNIIPILSLPFSILSAVAKHGTYEDVRNYITNHGQRLNWLMPRSLSQRTIKVLSFFAEHTGNMIRIAIALSAVALVALGSYFYGGGILASLLYQKLHRSGYVPRKIALTFERFMPAISSISLLVMGGPIIAQIMAAFNLFTLIPKVNQFVSHKIDHLMGNFVQIKAGTPTLEEFEAPLKTNKNMSYDQIENILNSHSYLFEVNPAHTSKAIFSASNLADDTNYEELFTLHQKINWNEKENYLRSKLQDDERMLAHLAGNDMSLHEAKQNFLKLATKKAGAQNKTLIQFFVDWNRSEMRAFVDVLLEKRTPAGEEADLDETIKYAKKLLPYIKSLKSNVDIEDILLKLSVEAGGYCARGLKRCTQEIVNEIIIPNVMGNFDDAYSYTTAVLGRLQNLRHRIVQRCYQEIVSQLKIPNQISSDVHGFDIYRKLLSLGFYPISEIERQKMAIPEVVVWSFYAPIRKAMFNGYEMGLKVEIKNLGNTRFIEHIRKSINENKKLSESEKEKILEKLTSANNWKWNVEETNERFYRLMLVELGVLKYAPNRNSFRHELNPVRRVA